MTHLAPKQKTPSYFNIIQHIKITLLFKYDLNVIFFSKSYFDNNHTDDCTNLNTIKIDPNISKMYQKYVTMYTSYNNIHRTIYLYIYICTNETLKKKSAGPYPLKQVSTPLRAGWAQKATNREMHPWKFNVIPNI